MATTYLLNTSIIPNLPLPKMTIRAWKASKDDVRYILSMPWESAVGHQGTADFLTKLLGIVIPVVRKEVQVRAGDTLVCFKLKTRLPEGVVLTEEEMRKYDWEFLVFQF